MEQQNIPWNAISAKLKNEASEDQLLQIKEWLDLSFENPVILTEIINTWSLTKGKNQLYEPDSAINWEKLMLRIGHSLTRKFKLNNYYRWFAAASILILIFLAGLGLGERYLNHYHQISFVKIIAPEGSKTRVVLPDNTQVWLNSGSILQYPNDFTAKNREVYMKGECFFDVTKDSKHPFKVYCSKFIVKVYGTRFNVNENTFANETDLTLISGKVDVFNKNDRLISKLKPGQRLIYTNGLSRVQKTENQEALTSWINDILIIDNMPFREVKYYLEKWYGVKIQLDSSLNFNNNYTFKVKTESLREVLELISFITPIDYQIQGNQVSIKTKKHMKK